GQVHLANRSRGARMAASELTRTSVSVASAAAWPGGGAKRLPGTPHACALASAAASPTALDGEACRTVRLSDVGWTDVTSTTALFSVLLSDLGYKPEVTVLSVPVTFASM